MTVPHLPQPKAVAELRPFRLPALEEFETRNGLRVIVARRGALPLATLRLVLRVGSASDPPRKQGLADFTVSLLRRGTRRWNADHLDQAIEFYGGALSTAATEDYVSIQITAPSNHLATMLTVLGELVHHPTFPEREVASARSRVLSQLANDLDDPGLVAHRAVSHALWDDHPYGHDVVGVAKTVKTFTRRDVVTFHRQQFSPRQALLVIVGSQVPPQLSAIVSRALGAWKGNTAEMPMVVPPPQPALVGQALVIDKPDQTQSQVRIGAMGFPRRHPDFFAAEVMNTVLGGLFTSRLMQAIRVDRGLSYGANSSFDGLMAGGSFVISTFTKTETTREIIDVVLAELARLREGGASEVEIEAAQNYLAGLYPLRLESNESLAAAIAEMQLYQLGSDWVDQYRNRLRAVTSPQVLQAAQKYLRRDGYTYVVVGNAGTVRRQLKSLAPTRVVKISQWR